MFEWEHGSLGELANGVRGVSYTPNQLQSLISPETVILLRSNNIRDGKVNFDNIQLIPSHIVSKDQLAKHDDIAVCMSNGSKALVGKSGRIVGNAAPCTVGAFCSIFRPLPHADGKFVSYILQSNAYRRHLDIILAGSAINNLKNSDVEALPLEIPPKEEQRLIAHILDTLDTQIQKTEALIAKLEKVKEGLLHDLLTRGIDENGQLRSSPEQAPELYKESPLGLIPREWETKTIGHLSSSIVDVPFGSNLKTEHYAADPGIRVVRLQNITPFDYDDDDRAFITDDHAASLSKNTVKPGDVLIASLGDGTHPAGRACLYPLNLPEAINKADCFRLRAEGGLATNNYLMLFMNSDVFAKQARKWTQGVTLQRINTTSLKRIFISCPPLEEQESIAQKVNKMLFFLATQKEELGKLILKKHGLMDELLTGRVRVTSLLEQAQEPATA
ncbi:restriction endonuclease subunit S [Salinicola halophyticus]|uniref:restriction endonuclease subunit S n=1 Tax=Salinicola halophyticus TaxID=1808881 RepID=UPI003F481E63